MSELNNKEKKNVLWMTWKDQQHPQAGGAELFNEEVARRLVKRGMNVQFIVAGFQGAQQQEERDGFSIIRVGGRYSVYWKAYKLYKETFRGWPDIVIDEMNTIPFFAKLYVRGAARVLMVHQLCREVWFHQIGLPLSIIGYLLEPLYLRILSNENAITVSQSSKQDLTRFGFDPDNIAIVSVATIVDPVKPEQLEKKRVKPTVLSFGALRSMKRTLDIVRAFELAKNSIPDLQLDIAGGASGSYGKRVAAAVNASKYKSDIVMHGRVTNEKKKELFREAGIFCATSVKEGWGLTVTEAGGQGTPAVVYDVDGLRDSVEHNATGLVCEKNTPLELAKNIGRLFQDRELYARLQRGAYDKATALSYDKTTDEFMHALNRLNNSRSNSAV